MKCKQCNEFEVMDGGRELCGDCYKYIHGRERRELNRALSTGNLFLMFDILNGKNAFKDLKGHYNTDGALASNIKTLERKGYLDIHKQFRDKKTFTTYVLTENGKELLKKFLKTFSDINFRKCEIPACGNDYTVDCQICFRLVCGAHEVGNENARICSICKKETDENPMPDLK